MVLASQAEALTAVELHNSPVTARPLESYLVHMHLAWLYLLHAEFERDQIDYHYRDGKTRHYVRIDGDKKSWDLERCVKKRWPNAADSMRLNLDVTIKLRNKIEHRWERGLMVASYGFTQSLMINYDEEVVAQFGPDYSIADRVHLPVALSTFSREGMAAMVRAQNLLPKPLRDFFIDYRAGLPSDVLSDRAFEFRVEIRERRSSHAEAEIAIEYVRWNDLTLEEQGAYLAGDKARRAIVHEKIVHVPDDRQQVEELHRPQRDPLHVGRHADPDEMTEPEQMPDARWHSHSSSAVEGDRID